MKWDFYIWLTFGQRVYIMLKGSLACRFAGWTMWVCRTDTHPHVQSVSPPLEHPHWRWSRQMSAAIIAMSFFRASEVKTLLIMKPTLQIKKTRQDISPRSFLHKAPWVGFCNASSCRTLSNGWILSCRQCWEMQSCVDHMHRGDHGGEYSKLFSPFRCMLSALFAAIMIYSKLHYIPE